MPSKWPADTQRRYPPEEQLNWTPRQRQVLDLLVRGKTNAQIGEELGLSLEGAKWHIREIMSKLQVDSRDEAAAYWRQHRGWGRRIRQFGSGLWRPLLPVGAGIAGIAVVAAVAFIVLEPDAGDEPAADASATPPSSATATAIPTTAPTATPSEPTPDMSPGAVEARPLELQGSREMEPGTALWVVHPAREGSLISFTRFWKRADGSIASRHLLGGPGGEPQEEVLTGIASAPDASTMYATLCIHPDCHLLVTEPVPGMETRFIVSHNGGITWEEIDRRPGKWFLNGYASGQALAARGDEALLLPSMEAVEPPGESWPRMTGYAGQLAWFREDLPILTNTNGGTLLKLSVPDPEVSRIESVMPATGDRTWVHWIREGANEKVTYIGLAESGSVIQAAVREPKGANLRELAIPLAGRRAIVNTILLPDRCRTGAVGPAILDLDEATLAPVQAPFVDENGCPTGIGNKTVAHNAPVLEVTGAGTCLNVRESPGLDAPVLDCHADGVLLRDRGETRDADGETWRAVTTPSGDDGWAAARFVAE